MKKIYLLLSFSVLAFFASAQNSFINSGDERPAVKTHSPLSVSQPKSGGGFTEWFNFGEEIYNYSLDASYFQMHLWPDSTVLVEFTSGFNNPWKHSVGQVFDPYSIYFQLSHPQVIGDYSVDSIAIPYAYFRYQHDAPDTLIVQIYENSKITHAEQASWAPNRSWASVVYDQPKNRGLDPSVEHTILLDDDDTSMTFQDLIVLPVELMVNDSEHIAVTYTYIPGNPYNAGDTIDVFFDPPPVNRRNALLLYEYRDNDTTNLEPGIYNNAMTANTDLRYGQITWNGDKYIPGTAWNSGVYQMDTYFLVSNPPSVFGIEDNQELDVKVYPNPTNGALNVSLPGVYSNIEYTLVNALGQVAKAGNLASGNNQLDLEGLDAGMYSLTLLVDGKLYSQKVSKL